MRRRLIALTMGAAVLTAGTAQATAPTAAPVPLTGWNLVIPVDSNGGDSGDATTVSPAALSSPWLTRDSSGALDFWAPANGARLGISLHARTELRGPGTFTLGQGSAGLEETVTVTQVPDSSHDIIIGQMFPAGSTPFAMLHYQSGKVYGFVHDQTGQYPLLTGVPLGATFEDSITADGDTVTFSAEYNGKTVTQTATGIASWYGDTMHFQAGDYQQDVQGGSSGDGGRVAFSALCQYGVPGGAADSGGCGTPGGGGGTAFPSGYHQLVVQNSGQCVDVRGGSTADNTVVDQAACTTTDTAKQEFEFVPVSGGYGELQNQNSGSDIVVQGASTANGAGIVQYTRNGSANGLWLPVRQTDGSWQFKNRNSGLCLDQDGAVTTAGVQFDQWTCKAGTGTNQDFVTR
jgi:hypothetical protein